MPRTTATRRTAALLGGVVAGLTAAALAPAAAQAAPGFDVRITELPGRIEAGADPSTVTVVASTDVGRNCQKVRWSLVLTVDGLDLDQVRVDRVEDDGSFPLAVQSGGDTARLTDRQLDPGELCRDRTVTARYRVAVDEDADGGEVSLQAQAFDRGAELLAEADGSVAVAAAGGAEPTPSPSDTPDPGESAEADDGGGAKADETAAPGPSDEAGTAVRTSGDSGTTSLLGVGLVIGALLIFLGVGILLRMQLRQRRRAAAVMHGPAL